ncbi:4Fe-4S dicluster domain-containing protein [Pseudodesulfovibrio sp.]|uniref:4Fe-4S dicluster domain-containing protein n=1 Tax=unclassified Pseudodesulfovibrio TaxID=2661612 RepID=UPI003AFFE09C
MTSPLDILKSEIQKALPDLDMVIAWTAGPDSLSHTPLFITEEADVDLIAWDPRCAQNLAGYLPGLRGKKVGIVAKGCDSRSIVELLQEKLIDRDDVTIFGLHCNGTLDAKSTRTALGSPKGVTNVAINGGTVRITLNGEEKTLSPAESVQQKCFHCTGADAEVCDHFIGEHGQPPRLEGQGETTLERLEAMSMEERLRFWEDQMTRCIRCYACRSACPLCVCQDHCAAQSRDPHWVDQTDHPREKLMFQAMHALHTAGRCTECGECERACPMDLPIMTLKQVLNRNIKDIFDYQAGMDPDQTPPLFEFREQEKNIKEREW